MQPEHDAVDLRRNVTACQQGDADHDREGGRHGDRGRSGQQCTGPSVVGPTDDGREYRRAGVAVAADEQPDAILSSWLNCEGESVALVVQKFGGSSVATAERVMEAAARALAIRGR